MGKFVLDLYLARKDTLIGGLKLSFTKDAVCNVYMGRTLIVQNRKIIANKVINLTCGCLHSTKLKVVILSKNKLNVKSVEIIGQYNAFETDSD